MTKQSSLNKWLCSLFALIKEIVKQYIMTLLLVMWQMSNCQTISSSKE